MASLLALSVRFYIATFIIPITSSEYIVSASQSMSSSLRFIVWINFERAKESALSMISLSYW